MFKRHFIFQCVIFSVLFCVLLTFFVLVTVSYVKTTAEPQDREYTLLSSERTAYYSGIHRLPSPVCYVYVEETDKPLLIDSIVFPYSDVDALELIPSGKTITVGIQSEKSSHYEVSSLRYGDQTVLSFKDYLKAHSRNKMLGIVICSAGSLCTLAALVWGVISYVRTGYAIMFKKSEKDTEMILAQMQAKEAKE